MSQQHTNDTNDSFIVGNTNCPVTTNSAKKKETKCDSSDREPSSGDILSTNKINTNKFGGLLSAALKNREVTPITSTTSSSSSISSNRSRDRKSSTTAVKNRSSRNEGSSSSKSPSKYDVYMGRGANLNKLRCDSLYRKLILQNFDDYCKAGQLQKRSFALIKILTPVHNMGGTFYVPSGNNKKIGSGTTTTTMIGNSDNNNKNNNSFWKIGSKDEVLSKIMQALRDNKKNWKKNANVPCKDKRQQQQQIVDRDRTKTKRNNESSSSVNSCTKIDALTTTRNHDCLDPNNKISTINIPSVLLSQHQHQSADDSGGVVLADVGEIEERKTRTTKDKGSNPTTAATITNKNTNQNKNTNNSNIHKKKNIYLNEVNGHLLNISNRDVGVCGFYHDLLIQNAPQFVTNQFDNNYDDDDDIIVRFVWDNIISKLHQKYEDVNFILCPHSGTIIDVQQQQNDDSNRIVHVTFRTIRCIIRALTDLEYIGLEIEHRQRQRRLLNGIGSDEMTASESNRSQNHHHHPLCNENDTLHQKQIQTQKRRITTEFSTNSTPNQKKQKIKNSNHTTTTTTTVDSLSSIPDDCSVPSVSSNQCKKVITKSNTIVATEATVVANDFIIHNMKGLLPKHELSNRQKSVQVMPLRFEWSDTLHKLHESMQRSKKTRESLSIIVDHSSSDDAGIIITNSVIETDVSSNEDSHQSSLEKQDHNYDQSKSELLQQQQQQQQSVDIVKQEDFLYDSENDDDLVI